MTQAVLTLNGLVCGHGTAAVCGPLDAGFHGGLLHVLFGPNGSGKTTLARTLLGLLRPLGGSFSLQPKGAVAYLPQAAPEVPAVPLTVGELLDLSLLARGLSKAERARRVDAALRDVGLGSFVRRPSLRLSGGERQRVLLARALAQDAPLIVLDEPTASVDRESAVALWKLMGEVASDQGRIVLAITHDHYDGPKAAGRTWILDDAGLRQGTPAHA